MGIVGELPVLFMQGASIANLFATWEQFGIFDLVLPFLLIFCIIFGVLSATNILGKNKGINLILAMVIALMALRLEFVNLFFVELFPRFAMGLAALVVAVILIGLFIPKEHIQGWYIGFGVVGALIAIVVVTQTFGVFNFFGSQFWQEWTTTIISSVLVVAAIIGIIISMGDKNPDAKGVETPIKPHR
jgi:hypothetical protein